MKTSEETVMKNPKGFSFGATKVHFLKYKKHFTFFFHFSILESYFLNYKKFFRGPCFLTYKKSFLLRNYKNFFQWFRFLEYKKFSRGGLLLFFELGVKSAGFYFWKYKKSFLLRKYKKFFNIRARKFPFRKYKEFLSGLFLLGFLDLGWELRGYISGNTRKFHSSNIMNFFRGGFFWEGGFGLGIGPGGP